VNPDDRTGGLQAERTELAWVRTALACGALAIVAARLTGRGAPLGWALGLGVAVAVPGLAAATIRLHGLRQRPEPQLARLPEIALLAMSLALADVLALVLMVR
jgi:uncharacterized membrane protein YidH (DUF202 family)